jgi:hypothetical protein
LFVSRRGGRGPLGIPTVGPYADKHRFHRAGAECKAAVELKLLVKMKNIIFLPPDKVFYISRNRTDLSSRRFYSDYDGHEPPPLIHDSSDDEQCSSVDGNF